MEFRNEAPGRSHHILSVENEAEQERGGEEREMEGEE